MLVTLSPAKRLDFESENSLEKFTQPRLLQDTEILAEQMKQYSEGEIQKIMKVSGQIAELNFERYQKFSLPFNLNNSRQALLAFQGDVYRDIETDKYSEEDFDFAQDRLRILSGFYGVLRPLDLMQAYRLEMHTKLKNKRGKDLYEFWGEKITDVLNDDLEELGFDVVVDLASQQYFHSVKEDKLKARVIRPVFKEKKEDGYKIVAIYAKLARGTMANFIVKERVDKPEKLKGFDLDGYRFSEEMSEGDEWVFARG